VSYTFPRKALLDGHRPPVRILDYSEGTGCFTVLRSNGHSEEQVFVKRERLTFIPERKPKNG